ncbi:hypothetical protein HDU81_010391 [Chytriomyces hyalinus]|nr:hypothetical protein HDU81_010391 [Chytriomyces hyalinus]
MSTAASSMPAPASARDRHSLEASNSNSHALNSPKKKKGFMDRFVKPKSDEKKDSTNAGTVIADPMQYNRRSKESLLNSSKAILDRQVDPSKRVSTEMTLISGAARSIYSDSRDAGTGLASSSGHGLGDTANKDTKDTKAKSTANLSNSNYFKSRFESDDSDSPSAKVSKVFSLSAATMDRNRSDKTSSILKLAPLNDSDDDLPASSFLLKSSVASKKPHSATPALPSAIDSKLPPKSRNSQIVSSRRPNIRDDISSPDVFATKRSKPKMMKHIDSDESDDDNALQDSKSILNMAPRAIPKKKASPFEKKRKNSQSLVSGNMPKKKALEFEQKLPNLEAVPKRVNPVFENDQDSEDWTLKWCGLDVRPGDSVLATWGSTGLYSPCQIQNYDPKSQLFKLTAPPSNPQPAAVPRSSFFCRSDKGFLSCKLNLEAVSDFLASKSTKGLPPRVLKELPATLKLLEDILTGKRKSGFMDAWKSGDASRLQSLSYSAKTSGVLSSDAEEALFEETLRNAVEYPPDCLGDDLDVSLSRDRLLCSVLVPEALIEMKKNFSDMQKRDATAEVSGGDSAWVSSMLTLRESLTLGQKMRGI